MGESYGAFCDCDGAYSEFSSATTRKARKSHRCDECHGRIEMGETYEYASGKSEGEMWESKTCPRCMALVAWITAHVPCYCRMYGDLFEDRLHDLVSQARQTPGFAFGMLRRVAAVKRHNRAVVPSQAAALAPRHNEVEFHK